MHIKDVFTFALSLLPAFGLLGAASHGYGTDSIRQDPLGYDPKLEVVHLFKDEYPAGIAVSSTGRMFACYPASLDPSNTNDGRNGAYQVAELIGHDTERSYPNAQYNNPPGGAIDYTQNPPVTKGLPNYFLSVNSLFIDSKDYLYVLDNGRAHSLTPNDPTILPASPGGTKVIVINLDTNSVTRTYVFPPSVARPLSDFLTLAVDLIHQVAYISDSSDIGNNAVVLLDLSSGRSWRALERDPSVQSTPGVLPFVWGSPMYEVKKSPLGALYADFITYGISGICCSNDSSTLYYSLEGGRTLFSVPTSSLLNQNSPPAEVSSSVSNLGEKGASSGLACDSLGNVWSGNTENSGISMYNSNTNKTVLFIHDKRIDWVYSFSVGKNGDLYFVVNQLDLFPGVYPGQGPFLVDRRKKPYVVFRFRLPGGATKIPMER